MKAGHSTLSILMIPHKPFPCDHVMLETVYTKILPERGYEVVWSMPSTEVNKPTQTSWNGTAVHLLPSPATSNSGLYHLVNAAYTSLRACVAWARLATRQRFDIIQVRNGLLSGLLMSALARAKGAKFVYQLSFPFPEALIESARRRRPWGLWLRIGVGRGQIWLRTRLMKHASLILAISDRMRDDVIATGVDPEKVMVFPLGTECPEDPDSSRLADLRSSLHLDGNPVVLYFGAMNSIRQLDFLVRVASLVHKEQPTTRWVLVGPGPEADVESLRRLSQKLGVGSAMVFLPKVPHDVINAYLAIANMSVSPIPPIPCFEVSSPTKVIESLAMGCPVVGTPISDQAEVIKASGGGLIAPFEEKEFAAAIVSLLRDPAKARAMGRSGRAFVRKHRSYEVLADRLDLRYQNLVGKLVKQSATPYGAVVD